MFVYEGDDRRSSFRVCPSKSEPVIVVIDDRKVHALDIGAGGISFENKDLKKGETIYATIELPGRPSPVEVTLKVLFVKNQSVCHCRFEDIEEKEADEIHLYMLAKQKEDLRKERENRKMTTQ
jgi:hypothetical protein